MFAAFTRISEYKHAPNQPAGVTSLPGTIIYRVSIKQYYPSTPHTCRHLLVWVSLNA